MLVDFYVGNIAFETTEEELQKLFEVAGKVRSIHMITDHKTGQFKGCAYVKMADVKVREVVDTLDGALLGPRRIEVSEARPQKPGGAGKPGGERKPTRNDRPGKRRP
jgi:RNA recognition motif-containing protein